MPETKYGKNVIRFLKRKGFENFVSNMEFRCFPADENIPQEMFIRIGLVLIGKEEQIGVSIEADYRLWKAFFRLPAGTSHDTILTLCRASSISDRQRMVKKLPLMAARHELAADTKIISTKRHITLTDPQPDPVRRVIKEKE